jgi:hypothetical protein
VRLEEQIDGQPLAFSRAVDCVEHGIDVAEHFRRGHVMGRLAKPAFCIGVKKTACADLQSLDPRGGDRFGAQQQTSKRLAIGECIHGQVEANQGGLCFADIGSHRALQDDLATDKEVGNVDLVVAREAIFARQTGTRISQPVAPDNLGHVDSLIKVTE